MLVSWCISNQKGLEEAKKNNEIILVYYEDLFQDPYKELQSILEHWGKDIIIDESLLRKRSSTTISSSNLDVNSHLISWKKSFSEMELNRFQEILDEFSISEYSIHSPLPLK